ncbi:Uncharacterised protein [uncultured archaeon]|nr:Uncharacterised protein [uncultured archaeon]
MGDYEQSLSYLFNGGHDAYTSLEPALDSPVLRHSLARRKIAYCCASGISVLSESLPGKSKIIALDRAYLDLIKKPFQNTNLGDIVAAYIEEESDPGIEKTKEICIEFMRGVVLTVSKDASFKHTLEKHVYMPPPQRIEKNLIYYVDDSEIAVLNKDCISDEKFVNSIERAPFNEALFGGINGLGSFHLNIEHKIPSGKHLLGEIGIRIYYKCKEEEEPLVRTDEVTSKLEKIISSIISTYTPDFIEELSEEIQPTRPPAIPASPKRPRQKQ